jgi:hypothetical protein
MAATFTVEQRRDISGSFSARASAALHLEREDGAALSLGRGDTIRANDVALDDNAHDLTNANPTRFTFTRSHDEDVDVSVQAPESIDVHAHGLLQGSKSVPVNVAWSNPVSDSTVEIVVATSRTTDCPRAQTELVPAVTDIGTITILADRLFSNSSGTSSGSAQVSKVCVYDLELRRTSNEDVQGTRFKSVHVVRRAIVPLRLEYIF